MVFGLGGPYTTTTPASTAKENLTSVIVGSGTDLAGLVKSGFSLYRCTATGSGLIINHLYMVSADFTTLIDVTGVGVHGHTSSTDGGSIVDILRSNPRYIELALTKTDDLKKASWNETSFTGGTAEDTIDGTTGERSIRLRTNTTSGAAHTISYPHLQLDFSKRSMVQFKVRLESIVNLALHSGVNCDFVTATDSNTAKYDAEICTTTNGNWHLRTASGSNKTMSDTGVAATVNRTAIKIEHYPDFAPAEVDLYIDVSGGAIGVAGTVFQKTSDIPVTGQSADNTLIVHSIKNSIAGDRPYHVYGSRLCYFVGDHWI